MRLLLILPLLLSVCQSDETISGYGVPDAVYQLQELNNQPYAANATITFPEEGGVIGTAPCNDYTARQTVPYPWIKVEAIAATKRACPDLALEGAFFASLAAMTLAEVSNDILILSNDAGEEMVFKAN